MEMFRIKKFLAAVLLVVVTADASAAVISQVNGQTMQVCFTLAPGGNCTDLIVNTIESAKKTVNVQAYIFTSVPILKALADDVSRGIAVNVLLDKDNVSSQYSVTNFLQSHDIPFLIDYKPAIAHNKVMIIDGNTVITGSFNFTKAAQNNNAENVLIISGNPNLAQAYQQNFDYRASQSVSLDQYLKLKGN